MFSKKQLQKSILSLFFIFVFLFNTVLPAKAQGDYVTSGRIGGGSSVYVYRTSSKVSKGNYAPKRRSVAKRTAKQRRTTRRSIARQSRVVARKNRVRRNIKTITPQELEDVQIERKTPQEASVVLAGAGEYFVEKDEFEKAVGYLEQAVELDEKNTDAKLALSEVYTMLGDQTLEKADEYAELAAKAVAERNEEDKQKYLREENTARQKGEKYFRRAIELDPKNASAYASLGGYLDSLDKVESDKEAQANYEKALELDANLTDVKAPLGIIYYQEGLIEKAEKYITEAMNAGEDNAETQYFMGLIRYKQNDNVKAKQALEKSIGLDDDNEEAHYYLGAVLTRLGEEDRAITEFQKATLLDATFVLAWFDLGVAYYNKGMYQKAIEAFNKAIELNRNQTEEDRRVYQESFANLGETYRQTENYDKAVSHYRNAVDLIKNDPELFSSYGFVLAEEDKWIDAINAFKKVTELQPDEFSFGNLGWAYYQEALYHQKWNRKSQASASLQNAKTALETAISKNPNFPAPYLNLGATLRAMGSNKEAVTVLEKARILRKDWLLAEFELGVAYLESGDQNKAIGQFKKVIKSDKNSADAYFYLGKAEYEKGDEKEARKILQELRKLNSKKADELEKILNKPRITI